MTHMKNTLPAVSGNSAPQKPQADYAPVVSVTKHKRRVNWHEAAACAIEIELRDYADLLQFLTEYILGKNSYRIDLLVVKKLTDQPIFKNIACIFKTYNLFECKGIHSSLTVSSYYKIIGYAGILIDQLNRSGTKQYNALDVSITFLTFHHPRKLIKHLTSERKLTVAKSSDGIYDISKETFTIQIIVTHELPADENLYLRCLTTHLTDASLIKRLSDDYRNHANEKTYRNYLNQLTTANSAEKGESQMLVCEGLLNLYGTSSEEIITKTRQETRQETLKESEAQINALTASVEQLSSQNMYLKELLRQNNISYE